MMCIYIYIYIYIWEGARPSSAHNHEMFRRRALHVQVMRTHAYLLLCTDRLCTDS